MLSDLMRKTRLITQADLIISWRTFYEWARLIFNNHDKTYGLITLPKDIESSLIRCTRTCAPYFSATATQEILDELRPQMCPIENRFYETMRMFKLLLPANLPPNLHSQGFKLWLSEFFGIWESMYNHSVWEWQLTEILSSLAWNNIGYIDWEPWLSQIFTRILRGFSLPIGKMQTSPLKYKYIVAYTTKWIVAMIGNGNSCLQYLRDLFISIKSFYHPSNTAKFQENLVKFVLKLAEDFVDRVHLERKTHPVWFFAPLESHRLTEQDITDFVNCVKEYAFISIFNKDYAEEAVKACQYLSILRPELIVPVIVEKHFSSINSMTEPHRFTSIMNCLTHIARQIVQQTPYYSHGQTYVLPLLMSALPGIDLNDMKKTSITLEFLDTILTVIICVDCSSAVNIRNDLTEIEKEVCLSTGKFEEFVIEFLNRIFRMIDILSADMSDAIETDTNANTTDNTIKLKLTSILLSIIQQCSNKIFQKIREKIVNFVCGECLSPKVRDIVACLVQALVKGNPVETLKYLLPKTCESIENILNNVESNIILSDNKEDIELTWYLILFAELVRARGDTLLIYKKMIMSVFQKCIHIINKNSYESVANAAKQLLISLTHVYSIDYRLTIENIDESFVDFLPIRVWGQYVDLDKLQVKFHIPNIDEIDFACEFVETFIYPELELLNEKCLKMSNNERLRSLTLIQSIAIGCFRMIPRIESKQIQHLTSSVVPYDSKYRIQFPIYSQEPKFRENLRMRLLTDIGKLLDTLIENHSDDVSSIMKALKFYPLISIYYGVFDYVYSSQKDFKTRDKLLKNKLCGEGQNIRSLTIRKMEMQIQEVELSNFGILTDIDKQIILKLFELSINPYSEVRRKAQFELFCMLKCYRCSFQIIIDPIVELLNKSDEIDHDQLKGCLYTLLGNDSFFFPTKYSWTMKEKLWPSIACLTHTKKISIRNLIADINKKINKYFVTEGIVQNINEISMNAAIDLWRPLEPNEMKTREEYNRDDIQSYTNLMETLCSLLKIDSLTWGQQKTAMSFLCLFLQNHVSIPSSCIRTFVDFLIHDNIELRKYATKGVSALCRLQKSSRIYVKKTLEEILHDIGKPLPISVNDECCPGDRDDNLWITFNDYKPPQTQIEWEQTCFLDKTFHGYYTWPKIIKYPINKRERYTLDNMPEQVAILYDHFIDKNFIIRFTQCVVFDEEKDEIKFDKTRFTMYKGLFRNFGLAFLDNFMEQLYVLIREKAKNKELGSHRVAAEIVTGLIRGSKYWTLEMLDELWEKLTPFLTEVFTNLSWENRLYWNTCFTYSVENEDPRRMHRLIDFMYTLINNKTMLTTANEISRWSLFRNLNVFQWRIPSILCDINQLAKLLLDHSSKDVRDRVANMLGISLSYDITLFNGKSIRQPNADEFFDKICERLHEAIETYEKTPLNQVVGIDCDARKAFDFIETVVRIHSQFFTQCRQPIKNGIIRMFSYLCEIESIAGNDDTFKQGLTHSRLYVGMSYLNAHYLDALIQQLTHICTSSKWHARRAAIESIQTMIFSNLFNARIYAKRLHELVLKCLFDEQFEVRIVASMTLSGFYQCGYVNVTREDMKHFCLMSKIDYFTKIDGKKVTLPKNIVQRHGGVLGLCAIVRASPYDIPDYVPETLMLLCEHSHDPDIIQKSVKQCLSEFRRTHHDSWHEHQQQFTEDQLVILADVFISHSYYA